MIIENGCLTRVSNDEIVDRKFTIPDSVTCIGDAAFASCSELTSVIIPGSVTSIGGCAFEDCSRLTSVTIPNSVTRIGNCAFSGCSSLANVTIGSGVTTIGSSAFSRCNRLTGVYINDLSAWCKIEFDSSSSNPLYYAKNLYLNNELVTDLVIPDGVTSIGNYAFQYYRRLTSVTIPDSVTSIGGAAFVCCTLTSKQANYKAFQIEDGELCCRGKVYSEGKRHYVRGALKMCKNGIHYCTNLFEIFNYYHGELDKDIAIYEIEVGSKVLTSDTSKCCTNSCVLKRRLYIKDILKILNGYKWTIK